MGKLAQKLGGQSQSQIQTKTAKTGQNYKCGGTVKACGGMVKKGKK